MSDLEDRMEIESLHSIFAFAADRGDYALLRSLYTDDAVDDHVEYNGPVDGYIEWVKKTHERYENLSHIYAKPLIAIDGDTAESEVRGHVYYRLKGDPPSNGFSVFRTFDTYVRTERGWRFKSRKVCGDWMGPHFEPADMPGLKGCFGKDDLVYAEVPKVVEALREISRGYERYQD